MRFLEAFCAYMEGIAKSIKMWFSGVGGVLVAVGICACFCDPAIAVEKVAHVIKSGVFFAAVGLFSQLRKHGSIGASWLKGRMKDEQIQQAQI